MKKNPFIGRNAADHVREKMKADPEFAAAVQAELAKLAIAAQVKRAREEKKLTQAQLAEKADTAQAVVARIENGKIPKLELLAKVSVALGCELTVRLSPARGTSTKPARTRNSGKPAKTARA